MAEVEYHCDECALAIKRIPKPTIFQLGDKEIVVDDKEIVVYLNGLEIERRPAKNYTVELGKILN